MDIATPVKHWYWFFENLYTPKEIKLLNNKIKKNVVDLKDNPATGVVKTSKVSIFNPSNIPELDRVFQCIHKANRFNFGFYLFDSVDERRLPLNYNVYDSKTKAEYRYHTDGEYQNPVSDTKLTSILNLSTSPYKGGEFYINPFGEEHLVPQISKPGTLLVFPSSFFHKVTPVIEGKRITVSIWSKGPKFR